MRPSVTVALVTICASQLGVGYAVRRSQGRTRQADVLTLLMFLYLLLLLAGLSHVVVDILSVLFFIAGCGFFPGGVARNPRDRDRGPS